jgi:hypothetical protein
MGEGKGKENSESWKEARDVVDILPECIMCDMPLLCDVGALLFEKTAECWGIGGLKGRGVTTTVVGIGKADGKRRVRVT